jgi:hypothetical protein
MLKLTGSLGLECSKVSKPPCFAVFQNIAKSGCALERPPSSNANSMATTGKKKKKKLGTSVPKNSELSHLIVQDVNRRNTTLNQSYLRAKWLT